MLLFPYYNISFDQIIGYVYVHKTLSNAGFAWVRIDIVCQQLICFWVAYTVIYDIVCEVRAVKRPFFSHMPKCPHMQTGASWESSLPS